MSPLTRFNTNITLRLRDKFFQKRAAHACTHCCLYVAVRFLLDDLELGLKVAQRVGLVLELYLEPLLGGLGLALGLVKRARLVLLGLQLAAQLVD